MKEILLQKNFLLSEMATSVRYIAAMPIILILVRAILFLQTCVN